MTDKELLEAFGQDVYVSCPKDFALGSIVLPGEFKLRRYDSKEQYQAETVIGLPTLMILVMSYDTIHNIGKGRYLELLYAEKHNIPVIIWSEKVASIEDWCYTSKDIIIRNIIDDGKNWNRYCHIGANNKGSLISKLKTFPVPTVRVGGGQWHHVDDHIFKMQSSSLYTEVVRCNDLFHNIAMGYLSKKQVGVKCTEEELLKFLPKDHPDRPAVPKLKDYYKVNPLSVIDVLKIYKELGHDPEFQEGTPVFNAAVRLNARLEELRRRYYYY